MLTGILNGLSQSQRLMKEDVPLVEFKFLVFTRMPGESYYRQPRSLLLCVGDIFQVLINSLVCWLMGMSPGWELGLTVVLNKASFAQLSKKGRQTQERQAWPIPWLWKQNIRCLGWWWWWPLLHGNSADVSAGCPLLCTGSAGEPQSSAGKQERLVRQQTKQHTFVPWHWWRYLLTWSWFCFIHVQMHHTVY